MERRWLIDHIEGEICDHYRVTPAKAKRLFTEALAMNTVIAEIMGQVERQLEEEADA